MKRTPPGTNQTSLHVHRVVEDDDEASWLWIVDRLTPLLELQARYRLEGPLRRLHDPADLLNDVWLRVYPRLRDLRPRNGRLTPVLLRFLSRTLLLRVNELLREHARRGVARTLDADAPTPGAAREPADERWTSVPGLAARSEVRTALRAALDELDANDREVLVLRGIEQVPNEEAASLLGVRPGTLAMRYRRARQRLRRRLPAGWIDDLL